MTRWRQWPYGQWTNYELGIDSMNHGIVHMIGLKAQITFNHRMVCMRRARSKFVASFHTSHIGLRVGGVSLFFWGGADLHLVCLMASEMLAIITCYIATVWCRSRQTHMIFINIFIITRTKFINFSHAWSTSTHTVWYNNSWVCGNVVQC